MLNVKDMTELIYIHAVIERNATEKLKKNDYKGVWEIMDNTSLTPEKRAKLLVGDEDGIGCE